MRARKVVTRSGKKIRGKFPSEKLRKLVHWESLLERDAILMLEYHPLVLRYQEQPSEEIYYDEDGVGRRCYPDFLCLMACGAEILLEIKRANDIEYSRTTQRKLGLIALTFERQQRPYRVLTEHQIRRDPLHSNLLLLHDARRATLANVSRNGFSRLEALDMPHTLGSLAAMLGSETKVLGHVARGHLRANLEERLSVNSGIWLPSCTEAGDGSFSI